MKKKHNQLNFIKQILKKNQTQLIILAIAIFPTLLLVTTTFISLWFYYFINNQIIQEFAEELYQDQISSSQLQNQAIVFQINQQVQKIAWQTNLLNEFLGRNLQKKIKQNYYHIPAIHNIDRSYYDDENPKVLALFKENTIYTSVWHLVNQGYLSELDERQKQQMVDATRLDSIWKAIMFDNKVETTRWLSLKELYVGHQYDGLIYMTSMNNTTPSNYQIPPNCPYDGIYKLDIRCRFYYNQTVNNISIVTFPPQIQYADGSSYIGSTFCQRRLKYMEGNPNLQSEIYSIICTTLDLSQIPQYFQNFGSNSKFQLLLDPSTQTIVYDSQQSQQYDQILTIQQVETDYLSDQDQSKIFLDNIEQYKQYILNFSNYVEFYTQYDNNQNSFEYQRNGTACFVIVNIISMIDKVPKFETLQLVNPQSKYELKNIFLFLDVLSKEKMEQFSLNLSSTLQFYKILFTYSSWGLILIILSLQFYYSLQLGRHLMHPVIHLTNILNQIQIQSIKPSEIPNRFQANNQYQNDTLNNSQDLDNNIHIDDHIFSDFEGVCYSSDTQELLYSFQNLFKILQFTTQNLYTENESISLLNLNIQIQHFQQFGNYRALGVCHNNMGILHYNSGRFQEAVEHFQQSIIYAKYELNMYSDGDEGSSFSNRISMFTINLRSSLFSNKTQLDQSTPIGNQQQSNLTERQQLNKSQFNYFIGGQQNITEKDQLYWNLYNRNQNYLKALSCYLDTQNAYLWDIFEDISIEVTSISQIYLQNSNKREMLNYYVILLGYFRQNKFQEASCILTKLGKLYIKDKEKKLSSKDQEKFLINQSSMLKKQSNSPDKNQINTIDHFSQIQNKSTLGNISETQKTFNLLSPIIKSYKKRISQNLQSLNQSQIDQLFCSDKQKNEMIKFQNIIKNPKNKQHTIDKLFDYKRIRKENLSNNNLSNNKSIDQSRFPPSFLEVSEERSARMFQDSPAKENAILVQSNQYRNFSNNSRIQNIFNFKNQGELNQQSLNNSNTNNQESPLKIQDGLSQVKQNKSSSTYDIKKLNLSKLTLNIYKQKSLTQSLSYQTNLLNNRGALQNNEIQQKSNNLFFQVRKIQKYNKSSRYEFSSDIYFQYYAIQLAKYQLIQQNPYQAALILTNLLEQCQYYLPHLKKLALKLLNESFKMRQVKSQELTDMNERYTSFADLTFQICLISVCHSKFYKKRVYALSHDLVNEILFKDQDKFGLFSYSFDEQIFIEQMGFTSKQTINSNPFFFKNIILQIFDREQRNEKEKRQQINLEKSDIRKQNTNNFDRQNSKLNQYQKIVSSSSKKKKKNSTHNDSNNMLNSNMHLNGIDQNKMDQTFGEKFIFQQNSYSKGQKSKLNLEGREGILKKSIICQSIKDEQIENNYIEKSSDSSCSSIESVLASQTIVNYKKNRYYNNEDNVKQKYLQKNQLNTQSQINKSFEKYDRQFSQMYDPQNVQNYQFHSKMFPQNSLQNIQILSEQKEQSLQQNKKIESDQEQQISTKRRKISNQFDNQSDFNSSSQIFNYKQMNDPSLIYQLSSNREKLFVQDSNIQHKQDNIKCFMPTLNLKDNLENQMQNLGNKQRNEQLIKNDNTNGDMQQIDNLSENYQTLNSSRQRYQDQKNKIIEYSFVQQNNQENDQTQLSSKQELKILSNQNLQLQSFSFFQKDITSDKQNQFINQNSKININLISEKLINDQHLVSNQNIELQMDKINQSDNNYEKYLNHQNQSQKLSIDLFQINNYESQNKEQQNQKPFLNQKKQDDQKETQFNLQNEQKRTVSINHYLGSQVNKNTSYNIESPTFKENHRDQNFSNHSRSNQEINLNINQEAFELKNKHQIINNRIQYSSEQVFHLSIQAALKKYILNSDQKLSTYLSYKNHKKICKQQKFSGLSKSQQGFLIYFTDQFLQLNNSDLLNELYNLLVSLDLQLLILAVNEKNFIEEHANLQNIYQDGKSWVLFFNSEEKLLQYIYNNREHIKSSLIPMAVEFF
ncbi:hypothetical protein ABPG74_020478 [Tetrahymena malaccensis]